MAATASHRAVSVQSQGPAQFNSLSVALLPLFKRWHINELLLVGLYTSAHTLDHTHRAACTSQILYILLWMHTQNTYYNGAFWARCVGRWHCLTLSHLLSSLPALLWDTARCKDRERKRERELKWRDKVVTCGSTPALEESEQRKNERTTKVLVWMRGGCKKKQQTSSESRKRKNK